MQTVLRKILLLITIFTLTITLTSCKTKKITVENYEKYFTIKCHVGNVTSSTGKPFLDESGNPRSYTQGDAQVIFKIEIIPNENVEIENLKISLTEKFKVRYTYTDTNAYVHIPKTEIKDYECKDMVFTKDDTIKEFTYKFPFANGIWENDRIINSISGKITIK